MKKWISKGWRSGHWNNTNFSLLRYQIVYRNQIEKCKAEKTLVVVLMESWPIYMSISQNMAVFYFLIAL